MKQLELYVHIPFCKSKCYYCDFLSFPIQTVCCESKEFVDIKKYVSQLCYEIKSYDCFKENYEVNSIFIGGGTPSLLSSLDIKNIFDSLHTTFHIIDNAEITIECNPGMVTFEKIKVWKEVGINRVSIGLQTADNIELKRLGRIHTWGQCVKTVSMLREVGLTNINIDLISGLPGQTVASYQDTLDKVIQLSPEHISAYSLILEEGTRLGEYYHNQKQQTKKTTTVDQGYESNSFNNNDLPPLPDEEVDREMYELTSTILGKYGYIRYEISNYAKEGFECKHNIGYWTGVEYLGIGLGASSYLSIDEIQTCMETKRQSKIVSLRSGLQTSARQLREEDTNPSYYRWKNTDQLQEYLSYQYEPLLKSMDIRNRSCIKEIEELSTQEQMEEFLILGLRLMMGVSDVTFQKRFGLSYLNLYRSLIEKLRSFNLIKLVETENDTIMKLTKQGIDVSNSVFVEFLS